MASISTTWARTLPGLLLALVPGLLGVQAPAAATLEELVAELRHERDGADTEAVRAVGAIGTRPAAEALVELYDLFGSQRLRGSVLVALGEFDAVPGAESLALGKLLDVAVSADARELRHLAVDRLALCPNYGKAFLATLVDAPTDLALRIRALENHTAEPRTEDSGWYRGIYRPGKRALRNARKHGLREASASARVGPDARPAFAFPELRALAFGALAEQLEADEVEAALTDPVTSIRLRAFYLYVERSSVRKATKLALDRFGQRSEAESVRAAAASWLAALHGDVYASAFFDTAREPTTSLELALVLGELLADCEGEGLHKRLARLARDEDPRLALFALRALARRTDAESLAALEAAAAGGPLLGRLAAIDYLAERAEPEARSALGALAASEEPLIQAAAVRALSVGGATGASWSDELRRLCDHPAAVVRNAAIEALAAGAEQVALRPLTAALHHKDWTTRLAALRALEKARFVRGVGAIILRLPYESGRPARDFADVLERLTGRPFGTNADAWRRFWLREAETLELRPMAWGDERERRRRRRERDDVSRTDFFGIQVESNRLAFVIDVSGSMIEPAVGRALERYEDARKGTRIEVAKRELACLVDELEASSLFNVIAFSDRVEPWQARTQELTDATRTSVLEHVEQLNAGGGTDVLAALELALADPEVDTVFLLSDGEPTSGVTDPLLIRAAVDAWNRGRGVRIHCVAIGGGLDLLDQLAADSGGVYLRLD